MTEPTPSEPRPSEPHAQAKYQLRFDWGFAGARAIAADADVVVWADALPQLSQPAEDQPTVATALAAAVPARAALILADLTTAPAAAGWILDAQVRLGRRAMVSIVAAGEPRAGGGTRFAVEDLLAAGAVIDALGALGIDYTSPEAAAACAAFTGLRGAVAHLLTASASGQAAIAAGADRAAISAAGRLGTVEIVTVLRSPDPVE